MERAFGNWIARRAAAWLVSAYHSAALKRLPRKELGNKESSIKTRKLKGS